MFNMTTNLLGIFGCIYIITVRDLIDTRKLEV